jgi:hypothetical protein
MSWQTEGRIMHVELEPAERDALVEVLESVLADLRYEIGDTDRTEYREAIKTRKALLEKVLAALKKAR